MSGELHITLPGVSPAEQGRLIASLQAKLREVDGVEGAEIKRTREDTQDAGTILSIILAGPAVVVAVKAINNWLTRNNQARIFITTPDGHVVDASGLESGDVPRTVEALRKVIPDKAE